MVTWVLILISPFGNPVHINLMIRVLFLIPTFDKGGAENVLLNLVNNINHKQFDITVQSIFDFDSQKELLHPGVRYKSFMRKPFIGNSRLMACIPARVLYNRIIKEKYDIVVSYLEGPTAHILNGCPYSKAKKVAWIHTAFDTDKRFYAGFRSKAKAVEAYQKYDRIAFVAQMAKESFWQIAGCEFPQSIVLYNTIESDRIAQHSNEPIDDVTFNQKETNIISVGKIQPVKGYDRLARIHKRLKDDGINIHTYLLGVGEQQSEIEKYILDKQLQTSFTFLGFKNNPYKYVAKADLFVCSSHREGFSTAVTESLIVGTPVVSTRCSGMQELLGDNNEFGIVTENDEDSLYDGIKRMLTTPGLLDHYKCKAKERAEKFSTAKTVAAVEAMLSELVKES